MSSSSWQFNLEAIYPKDEGSYSQPFWENPCRKLLTKTDLELLPHGCVPPPACQTPAHYGVTLKLTLDLLYIKCQYLKSCPIRHLCVKLCAKISVQILEVKHGLCAVIMTLTFDHQNLINPSLSVSEQVCHIWGKCWCAATDGLTTWKHNASDCDCHSSGVGWHVKLPLTSKQ